MPEQIKHIPAREMHKYVFGFIGVFIAIAVTYPLAFLRVSQNQKFAGFHVKSLTQEGKLAQPSAESVAVAPPVGSAEKTVQPSAMVDASQTVANNLTAQPFISGSTDKTVQTEQMAVTPSSPIAEISDEVQIKELNQKVYDKIAKVWRSGRRFKQALAYRVTVTEDGAISSYEALVKPALDSVQETPLPSLVEFSVNQAKVSTRQTLGQFKVVFTHRGILEVSPWHGWRSR
ncbi:hypothetical protein [Argonema galeatum]|uniref:hypothetical protein n=1 Tax=Argonema galeatum TaxID=2942762 RepID=UPI0020121535|nr:hypothetical protein [Argonema galeatum]MCL1464929.1 hypothetical protein [Argonema galeatum A003/A1]